MTGSSGTFAGKSGKRPDPRVGGRPTGPAA